MQNDWFDLNLTARPKNVTEVQTISLLNFLEPNFERLFNSTIKSMVEINEYSFDSQGYILKEYHKNFHDSIGHLTDYHKIKRTYVGDSIVILSSSVDKMIEKIYPDKSGFIKMRIKHGDTIRFERNSNHLIIRSHQSIRGTDTKTIILLENKINEKGDIINEKRCTKFFSFPSNASDDTIITDF